MDSLTYFDLVFVPFTSAIKFMAVGEGGGGVCVSRNISLFCI